MFFEELIIPGNNNNSISKLFQRFYISYLYCEATRTINIKRKTQLRILKTKENTNLLINDNYNYKQGHGMAITFYYAYRCYVCIYNT